MVRDNWGVLLAAGVAFLGVTLCLVLAQPSPPRLPHYQYEPARDDRFIPGGAACRQAVLAKLNPAETLIERERCNALAETQRLQTNDLIQQTRAADAAQAQTELAYQGIWMAFLQTLGGFLTLIAAIGAAAYARQAAKETKRGADAAHEDLRHSKEIAQIQLRAFLDVEKITITPNPAYDRDGKKAFTIRAVIKNFGQSLAENFEHRWIYSIVIPNLTEDRLEHVAFDPYNSVISLDYIAEKMTILLTSEELDAVTDRKSCVRVLGEFRYSDVFKRKWRKLYRAGSEGIDAMFWTPEVETEFIAQVD